MIVKEYGKSNKDIIMLLHGGGLSWWNYEGVSEILKSNYHVILPILDGHSGSDRDFTSIESNANEICEYTIIESALVCPMKMTNKLIESSINVSYGLINKKWFSKLQFKSLKIKEELFDKYYIDSSNITKDNMISFLKASSNYHLKNIKTNKSKSIVIVGSKERPIMIRSAKIIHDELINSELEILSGYYHGDLSINHPNEYAEKVKKLIK